MIVCHCTGVTERQIRRVVREGARSRNEVALACDASLTCGGCGPIVDEIVAAESERFEAPGLIVMAQLATG